MTHLPPSLGEKACLHHILAEYAVDGTMNNNKLGISELTSLVLPNVMHSRLSHSEQSAESLPSGTHHRGNLISYERSKIEMINIEI